MPAPDPPLLLTNGRVRSLDPAGPVAAAVLLRDGRIAALGPSADLARLVGSDTRVIDLAGQTVLPGLIDAHTHLEGTALHLAYYADCHAPPHRDLAGVLYLFLLFAEIIGERALMIAGMVAWP